MVKSTDDRALMDLCLNCTKPDCVGNIGCDEYRRLKACQLSAESEFPRIVIEQPIKSAEEGELLRHCNDAINALSAILQTVSMVMNIPSTSVAACLSDLKKERMVAYGHLIDWDIIANNVAEGEKHGP